MLITESWQCYGSASIDIPCVDELRRRLTDSRSSTQQMVTDQAIST